MAFNEFSTIGSVILINNDRFPWQPQEAWDPMSGDEIQNVVNQTKTYYDGPADEIYRRIWGDDVHLGLFQEGIKDLPTAAARTNKTMAQAVDLTSDTRVLDVGCGYGSAARHLAREHGCQVVGTNISEKELELAARRAKEAGLDPLVRFEYGDFHELQFKEGTFEVVWSQEAFLHGVDKNKILSECKRVLVPGGRLVFTDILVRKHTPREVRERIYERVKSPDMWDQPDYETALKKQGYEIERMEDWSPNVAPSYAWVRDQVKANREELTPIAGEDTVENTIDALSFWVDAANDGKIGWGFFVARRPG